MDKFYPKNIYPPKMPPGIERSIDLLTKPNEWDFSRFKEIMINLGVLNNGQYIPASNAPEKIHCEGWDDTMVELLRLMEQHGDIEFARSVRTDIHDKNITMGDITQGDDSKVQFDISKDKGKEASQRIVGTFHTHPSGVASYGLSPVDFITLLVQDATKDYLKLTGGNFAATMLSVAEFNKAVCAEFGLTMYMSIKENPDLFKRVEVVS
ncbi:MAG: hypothetical protein WCT29_01760 [Candidatus Paceibacterota bacterium]|jgi:hypothetical protein